MKTNIVSLCAAMAVVFAVFQTQAEDSWFDAGISGYTSWPDDGTDVVVEGVGTWSGTRYAELTGEGGAKALQIDVPMGQSPVGFEVASPKDVASEIVTVRTATQMSILDADEEMALPPEESKCALTCAMVDAETAAYFGLAKDPDGGSNVWRRLSGATPDKDKSVLLGFDIKKEGDATLVRYSIDEQVLADDANEWIEVVFPDDGTAASVSSVLYCGDGLVSSLAGFTENTVTRIALTIPEIEHVLVSSVKANGVVVEQQDGVYWVPQGAVITVRFDAGDETHALTRSSMTFVAGTEDMTLPETGRPEAVSIASTITINEVMAKNGVTLRTKTGFEGLDWIELYNSGDADANLTGWFMGNDPTKAPSKWKPIEGSCIVPAKGYKIVWFDGDGLCENWAADEAHVEANISTDAGKHTVFLASSNKSADDIVQQITLPGGIKDVSYGLGHLSRTVVSATAAAQYKVGGGEWKPVAGPAGMSSAVGGFKVVEYKINRSVSTMDDAETCIADPSTWKYAPATNTAQRIAFGSGGTFDSSLYANFPAYNEDDIILVATGTIVVPTAGDWSFAVGSDDGFSARLSRLGASWAWESRGTRAYEQSAATFNLEAGAYAVEIVYFNRSGGRVVDFSAAEGRVDFSKDVFSVVGTEGCPVVHGGALLVQIAADVKDEMLGKETTLSWKTTFSMAEAPAENDTFRLLMRYTDGFTATLNGETVVTVPQPASRTAEEALVPVVFTIPGSKVAAGANTLEIVSENNVISDTELLIAPELKWDLGDEAFVYSTTPTPGAQNAADGRSGFTPKVKFSVPHGYKDAAFELSLSCPDNPYAVIYYTLDGTSPAAGSPGTFRYTDPFEVSKTTVVRAAVPDADSILQQDTSATYLFIEEIIAAGATPPDGFPADKAVNSQAMKYGMSTAITQSGDEDTQLRLRRGFTNGVRTVSLVIDPKSLFDKTKGIYVNASGNGRIWERQTMVEQINPTDSDDEFNIPAGIRIRGAVSRGSGFPKHSFRLFFRSEYGMGTLKHKMFGDENGAADEFEKLDFRTEQNYAWSNGGGWETFVHEVFARDSQRDMGECYNRSRYYHLFINGVYWGLYQTEERVDQNYAESYGGGVAVAENYDVVRTSQPSYSTGVVEGESEAWENLWRITTQEGYGEGHEGNYNLVRGLKPDGTRDPELPVYVNVTNLIVYMLTSQFAADTDSPANSSGMANNLAAFRNRVDGSGKIDGFVWNRHDAEHSLSRGGGASSGAAVLLYGTRGANHSVALGNFNPAELHYELCANAEYRRTFADLVYKFILKEGGALTAPECEKRFCARMAEIDDAIVCESARWGGSGKTRATWLNNCNDCINFINRRTPYLIAAYRELGWYPSVDASTVIDGTGAPVGEGVTIAASDQLYLTVPAGGTVYYTTDGTDPLSADGAPSAAAIEYSGASPAPIDVPVLTKGSVWKYFDAGSKPAENWVASDYDDTTWKSGASRLGFANSGTFATALNRYVGGASSGTQVVTYYFRRTFTMPAGAESMTSLKAALDCDDGYVAYVNGVEIGRDQVGSTDYSAFATGTNMGERDAVWTFPAGTLVEGENVIAVEVHQCNATSSDAWWNLALSYAKAGNVEGGIVVPPEGLTINARVLADGEAGEWSALSTIVVKGEEILATQAEAVRVAAVYSSTADAKGDGAEFITLTNITEHAVLLDGLVIKAAKQGYALATLCTLAGGRLEAGASITLTKAENWPSSKITNGKVEMTLTAGDGKLIQSLCFEADWWDGRCDETGIYFVAKEFGDKVTDVSQWKPSVSWVEENLRFYEIEGIPAEGNDGAGEYFVLTNRSDSAELDLTGVKIVIGKKDNIENSGDSAAKCKLTLVGGTVAAHSTLKFKQPDYAESGWEKIANGDLILKIYDAEGALVQYSEIIQDSFTDYAAGQKALRATSFERETGTGDWMEVDLPQSGSKIEGDGFLFYLAGEFAEPAVIAPTGDTCCVVLDGATVPGLTLQGAGEFTILASNENQVASLSASVAKVTVEGDGALCFTGANTLVSVLDLTVKSGTFAVKSTGVSATKTPVVNVLGNVRQTGGTIDVDLDVATDLQIYGIYVANKDMTAEFAGGTFTAKVGGTKSAAIYGNKGSVDPTFSGDVNVTVELTGPEARFVNAEGNVKLKGGVYNVAMPDDCASLTNARVFKATKDIKISGGTFTVEVPAAGSEIFSSDREIAVSGGVLSLQAADDCFSATGDITISSGVVQAVSRAGDAIDSNGSVTISGGQVFAFTCSKDHDAIDVDPILTEESSPEHNLIILDGATVVAVGGDQKHHHGPDAGSTATYVTATGLTADKKYVLFSSVVTDETSKTTRYYAVNWNEKHPEPFTLIIAAPGFDGTYSQVENPAADSDESYVEIEGLDKVYVKTVEEQLPTEIVVEPGLVIEVTAADAEAAKEQVVLKVTVPAVDEVPVVDEATYRGYFVLEAKPVEGKDGSFAVEAVLNEAVVKPVIEETNEIATPFAVGETGGEVTVAAKPGLYYSLVRGAEVGTIDSIRDCKLATGTKVELADTEKLPDAAFYRVKVTVDELTR